MPYRVAAGVLQHLLPVEAGKSPETLRGHTLKAGEHVCNTAVKPAPAGSTAKVTVDSPSFVAVRTAIGIWRSASATSRCPVKRGEYSALSREPIPTWRC